MSKKYLTIELLVTVALTLGVLFLGRAVNWW